MSLRILVICASNVCRSPLAADLLASRLDPAKFQVDSAGTSAVVGGWRPEPARLVATRRGASAVVEHRAVAVTAQTVASADLILGLELAHRRRAVQLHPPAVRRACALLEFAHIVSELSYKRLLRGNRNSADIDTAALEMVTRMRGAVTRLTPLLAL